MSERLVYGKRPVREALAKPGKPPRCLWLDAGRRAALEDFALMAEKNGVSVEWVERTELDRLCRGQNHQGIVAAMPAFGYVELAGFLVELTDEQATVLLLDEVTDPQNVGSILRAAGALGVSLLVLPKHRGSPITETVGRIAAGAAEHVPVARETNLTEAVKKLQKASFWVYGLAGEGQRTLAEADLTGRTALVVGNEGAGLRRRVAAQCDDLLAIPGQGPIASLNVAQAASIGLYEIVRQRLRQEKESSS